MRCSDLPRATQPVRAGLRFKSTSVWLATCALLPRCTPWWTPVGESRGVVAPSLNAVLADVSRSEHLGDGSAFLNL